jgi:CheY-like chemotaxis protein
MKPIHLLLADDDQEDCELFQEILNELDMNTNLTTVNDGEQLMVTLSGRTDNLPDVVFLDLNMPRKSGFTCLEEMKEDEMLKKIPIVIFSTSYDPIVADKLYKNGARYYICKPSGYSQLKHVISSAITHIRKQMESANGDNVYLIDGSHT